jgi:hypothetical protein
MVCLLYCRYEKVTASHAGGTSQKGPRTVHVGGLEAISDADNIEDEAQIATLFEKFGRVAATSLRYRREPADDPAQLDKVSWALVSFATSEAALSAVNAQEDELLRTVSKRPLALKMLDLEKAMTSHGSMREIALEQAKKLREYDTQDGEEVTDHASDVDGAGEAAVPDKREAAATAKLAKRVADLAQRVEENERAAARHRARVEAALDILLRDHEEGTLAT